MVFNTTFNNISVISWRHIQIEFKSEGGYFDKNKEVNLA
jgi:hypothetical protein